MKIENVQTVYWLERHGSLIIASVTLLHLYGVIGQLLKKPISVVTVKEAIDAGFLIRRA